MSYGLPTTAEDQPCTGCNGTGKQAVPRGSAAPDAWCDVCTSCDGTGSGYREWLNEMDNQMKQIKGIFENLGPHNGMGEPHKNGSYYLVRLLEDVPVGEIGQDVQMLVPRHHVDK